MTRKFKMGDKVKHGGSTYVFFCYPTNEDNTVDRNTVRSGQVLVYLDSATNTPNFFTPRKSQGGKSLYARYENELTKVES